jgi:hypothetical protein
MGKELERSEEQEKDLNWQMRREGREEKRRQSCCCDAVPKAASDAVLIQTPYPSSVGPKH